MVKKKIIHWKHLDQLCIHTDIIDLDHQNISQELIFSQQKLSRNAWRSCKKRSVILQKKILSESSELLASEMRTTEEKAVRAIMKAEESRIHYQNIREALGKLNTPLTQVDALSGPNDPLSCHHTISSKAELEDQILIQNR
jgi:hypothetical protein